MSIWHALFVQKLRQGWPPHLRPAASALAASELISHELHSPPQSSIFELRGAFLHRLEHFTMGAVYRPTEAISLLRPSFLLPRIQRKSPLGRAALSTTRHAQAQSPLGTPNPAPQRKSITLTGDTGRVRWADLSPGEKVVRTTQQSFNMVVVVVGIIATVGFIPRSQHTVHILIGSVGWRRLLSLRGRLLSLLQDRAIQSRNHTHTRRPAMPKATRSWLRDLRTR